MSDDVDGLIERWILTFCEVPPLIDLELMNRLLIEHDGKDTGPPDP